MSRSRLTAAAAVGCILVFASTLATSALWRTSVSLDGGDVHSGSVVLLNGDTSSQVKAYAFTALGGSTLRPGSAVQAPLVMRNAGTSALDYRLAEARSTGSATLASQLRLRVDAVSGTATGSCPTGVGAAAPNGATATLYDGALTSARTTTPRRLAAGASEALCVRVAVDPAAPTSAAGTTTQTTFTFGAEAA